jgi:alpha-L-fucosidase
VGVLNGSWGYCRADDEWKPARADGSVPEPSVHILNTVGGGLARNGQSIYGTERARMRYSEMTGFTRRGNTLYLQVHFRDGPELSIPGLESKALSARLLATGEKLTFRQDKYRLLFTGLPATAPDDPVTVIEFECDREPVQMDRSLVRGRDHRGKA